MGMRRREDEIGDDDGKTAPLKLAALQERVKRDLNTAAGDDFLHRNRRKRSGAFQLSKRMP